MAWLFSKKTKLTDSDLFNGLTDWHSHILPGVDDGFKDMKDSLDAINKFEKLGISRLWLTPHVMEDYPNTPEFLKSRFEELKQAYNGTVELRLASENMLDSLFEERLQENNFLPIGEKGNMLLVETSYFNPPYAMDDMIEGIIEKGYTPLLAHPERYRYMDEKDYNNWRHRGVKFQINYLSLVGGYGDTARKKAEWLIKNGMVEASGSDLHRIEFFDHCNDTACKAELLTKLKASDWK